MRFLILIIFLSQISCTSFLSPGLTRYDKMNNLWKRQSSRSEVIEMLGSNNKEVENGIVYNYLSLNYPRSGHFFNQKNQLIQQFAFLDEVEFEQFKKNNVCAWIVEKKIDTTGHAIKTIENGRCENLQITYVYPSSINGYELRWKK